MNRRSVGAHSTIPTGYCNQYGQFISIQNMTIGQMIQHSAEENDRDVIC